MENKKKLFLLILLLLLIIGGIFAFRSCNPRQKAEEDSAEATDTDSETLSDSETSSDSETETASDAATTSDSFNELSAFINANIEFTCEIIKNPSLAENQEEAKTKVNAAYAKYGLPVEDDKQMIEILKKYENDNEVISIVKENTKPCKEGNEPIFYKQD